MAGSVLARNVRNLIYWILEKEKNDEWKQSPFLFFLTGNRAFGLLATAIEAKEVDLMDFSQKESP